MDVLFLIAVVFLIGCFIFRKRLGIYFHSRKGTPRELPMAQEEEKPVVMTYKVLAYNARDYKDTKELENAMELRLEQCLAGLTRQGNKYEVSFHATGFILVYLVKFWY